jgi:hypothetical protein
MIKGLSNMRLGVWNRSKDIREVPVSKEDKTSTSRLSNKRDYRQRRWGPGTSEMCIRASAALQL